MSQLRASLAVPLVTALALTGVHAPAQGFSAKPSPQMRYVDFHRQLDQPGVIVAVGTLGKVKEGKRERLPDGRLGGRGSVSAVSGTQYFKVPVKTSMRPRAVFGAAEDDGKNRDVKLEFAIQLARLPDGSERRQVMTGAGVEIGEDTLALFVLGPGEDKKKKALDLLHVIPFDSAVDEGPDATAKFADAMHDFYVVNRRVADLEQALATVDAVRDGDKDAEQAALAMLAEVVERKPELRISENDVLLTQHVAPLEARAGKRLAAAGKEPGAGKADPGKD